MDIKGHRKSKEIRRIMAPSRETTLAFGKTSMIYIEWNSTEDNGIERSKTNIIVYIDMNPTEVDDTEWNIIDFKDVLNLTSVTLCCYICPWNQRKMQWIDGY